MKMSKSMKGIRKGSTLSTEWKNNISTSMKKIWNDETYKEKTSASIKLGVNTPTEIERRKCWAAENLLKCYGCVSKLHRRIRDELRLSELGFISEQRVGIYRVDELNEKHKVIIEINGDYVHANPNIYNEDDIIRIRNGVHYSAKAKWEKDEARVKYLENLGYTVITIWETDDLGNIRLHVSHALNNR